MFFLLCVLATCAMLAKVALVLGNCDACIITRILDRFSVDYGQKWTGLGLEEAVFLHKALLTAQIIIFLWALVYSGLSARWFTRYFANTPEGDSVAYTVIGKSIIVFTVVFIQMTLILDITSLMNRL
ncbi:MAG: hypothetical protein KDD76_02325 [Rickettsiales bacterium]|nr:hypothetical protein [Rickettsiales bacterium]